MSLDSAARSSAIAASSIRRGWLAYLFFVAYGSLVPLDFHPLPLAEAGQAFLHLRMLQIGLEGRADWIANGVLYVPLAFLTASLVGGGKTPAIRLAVWLAAVVFCCGVALAIEFGQLFFPPRTVSMNDVIAEGLGSLIGATLAVRWTGLFRNLVGAFSADPARLRPGLLKAYALAYLMFSLFPYDFLLSFAELERKLDSGNAGWFFAGAGVHGGILMAMVKLAAEALAAMPFGLLLGHGSAGRYGWSRGFLFGAVLGLLIEVAQFFVYTGISQGASVLTRALGVAAGAALWQARWDIAALKDLARRYRLALGAVYLMVLAAVNGWFGGTWVGADLAAGKLAEVHFMPLYYHYYTSEAIALVSLISVCLMYAPIGLLSWLLRASPTSTALLAASAACVVETGKLFLQGAHPDPTDILIAAFAAWAAGRLADRLAGGSSETKADAWPSAGIALLAALVPIGWSAANFPFHPALLGFLLAGYAALIWRHPPLLVAAIPAALPVLDLAPWSGRFYFDEFDLLLMVSLAVGYARVPRPSRGVGRDRVFLVFAAAVGLSYAMATVLGLVPWRAPDANSFNNYYSPYNALRIAKGALWAFLLYGLLRRFVAAGTDVRRLFAWGMAAGLAGAVAAIVWERMAFPGLFDFASDYRVTGPFAAMHTGGAYIEAFLAAAMPFLVLLLLQLRSLPARLAGGALLLAATYALMVTFSRNGYAAFAVALVIVCLAAVAQSARRRALHLRRGAALVVLAALAVAVPIFQGLHAQSRLSEVGNDMLAREAHWADAMRIRDSHWVATLFGMGIGRYPEMHYWQSSESHTASYRLETVAGNTFLRLGTGGAIYLEQFVAVEPQRSYLLSLDALAHRPDSWLNMWLCEKWLLTSFKCLSQVMPLGKEIGVWRHHEIRVASNDIGGGRWYERRPVKLALYNPNGNAVVDVDNVRLEGIEGRDLLTNGDFSRGLDRWFFSTDNHLPWHIKSMPLAILFDQGWLGVVALGMLCALAVARAARAAWGGNLGSGALLASLVGLLVVGVFDSLVDAPRFLLLFLLLAWLGSLPQPTAERRETLHASRMLRIPAENE